MDYCTATIRPLKEFHLASLSVSLNHAETKVGVVVNFDNAANGTLRWNIHRVLYGGQQDHIVLCDVKLRNGCGGFPTFTYLKLLIKWTWFKETCFRCGTTFDTVENVSVEKNTKTSLWVSTKWWLVMRGIVVVPVVIIRLVIVLQLVAKKMVANRLLKVGKLLLKSGW